MNVIHYIYYSTVLYLLTFFYGKHELYNSFALLLKKNVIFQSLWGELGYCTKIICML